MATVEIQRDRSYHARCFPCGWDQYEFNGATAIRAAKAHECRPKWERWLSGWLDAHGYETAWLDEDGEVNRYVVCQRHRETSESFTADFMSFDEALAYADSEYLDGWTTEAILDPMDRLVVRLSPVVKHAIDGVTEDGSTSAAVLACLLLALVPVGLAGWFVASLAGAVAGMA